MDDLAGPWFSELGTYYLEPTHHITTTTTATGSRLSTVDRALSDLCIDPAVPGGRGAHFLLILVI